MSVMRLSRRHVTQSLGVVLATFALPSPSVFGQAPPNVPFSLRNNRKLEGWIRLEADETVTVFTGQGRARAGDTDRAGADRGGGARRRIRQDPHGLRRHVAGTG